MRGFLRRPRWALNTVLAGIVLALPMPPAMAVEERVDLRGIPVAQWIVLIDGGRSEMLPASIRSEDGAYLVSAEVGDPAPHTLMNAVVQLADGSMISTPLRTQAFPPITGESRALAERRRGELLKRRGVLRSEIARLEREVAGAQSELRVKAGLSDVDKVYEKRAAILAEIQVLRAKAEP